jgi:NTE family protein
VQRLTSSLLRIGVNRTMRRFGILLILTPVLLSACVRLHYYTSRNEEDRTFCSELAMFVGQCPPPAKPTRAAERLRIDELPNRVFVGIALSGGGSRAANFSAAVLSELEKLGFLRYAAAISSVSGSSLTAAYYGLHSTERDWSEKLRNLLANDFERLWLRRVFYPQNVVRLFFTDFDRSDVMADVFDAVLFDGKRFGDMPLELPRIFINATQYSLQGQAFVFSDGYFSGLRSRLDTYPISHAVMASAAFPGAFHNVTLTNFSMNRLKGLGAFDTSPSDSIETMLRGFAEMLYQKERGRATPGPPKYVHLYDAGPSDNLGVTTLLGLVRASMSAGPRNTPDGCFLFVVDAYAARFGDLHKGGSKPDTVEFIDHFIDRNALDAADLLLSSRRRELLTTMGLDHLGGGSAFGEFVLLAGSGSVEEAASIKCAVWHLSLDRTRLLGDEAAAQEALSSEGLDDDTILRHDISDIVNEIDTRFFLTSDLGSDPIQLQNALYLSAYFSVKKNTLALRSACQWFEEHGLSVSGCSKAIEADYGPALAWYTRAAEAGSMEAQGILGLVFEKGEGVPRDCKKVLQWYGTAAENGSVKAATNLAILYANGKCSPEIEVDYREAARLLLPAAEKGYVGAQVSLGILYVNGKGVQRDLVRAYAWYKLAAKQGDERAAVFLHNLRNYNMTPEQVGAGDDLAATFLKRERRSP